jgi:predicted Rossmann fold flavoprotein
LFAKSRKIDTISPMKIAIIGGGAAGMMCAATLLEHHLKAGNSKEVQVVLFEKNSVLGKKVSLSGGGRCNVTTGLTDHKTILTKYTRGAEFFKPILGKFGPKKVCGWFERHGVPLKCEEDLRIFPVSDSGEDVIGAFQSIFSQAGKALEIRYRTSVIDVSRKQSGFQIAFKDSSPGAVEQTEIFDVLVLTTGGNAYAHTGSTGDGYALAARL